MAPLLLLLYQPATEVAFHGRGYRREAKQQRGTVTCKARFMPAGTEKLRYQQNNAHTYFEEAQIMKKYVWLVLCLSIAMLFVANLSVAYTGGSGIKGTPHDLSSTGGGQAYGDSSEQGNLNRICIYCHAPHNTIKQVDAAGINYIPLWNHAVTAQTYVMYSNGSEKPNDINHQSQAMDLLAGKNRPGSVSRLCLSCHDGTVSTNSYGFYSASSQKKDGTATVVGTAFEIGGSGSLANHHPIGFNYADAQLLDDELALPTTIMTTGVRINDLLWNNNMECTTCHDVHNTKNPGAEKFLWKSDAGSEFCMTCHLKKKS